MVTVILFALGILLGSTGGILLRKGGMSLPEFSPTASYVVDFVCNPWIVAGFVLYLIPALIWTYLLSKYPVSIVQPVLALTYVVTPILAMTFLAEPVPWLRWIGIGLIVVGVAVVSLSASARM